MPGSTDRLGSGEKKAQKIGLPLFVQKGRQMALTEPGRELNRAILSVFLRLQEFEEVLASLHPRPVIHARRSDGELRKIGGTA